MMWLSIVGMAMITYINRYAFLTTTFNYEPSQKVKRLLSYSSYSVLTAIWTPIVFQVESGGSVGVAGMDYLIACSLAAIMSFYRLPSLLTVILSAAVFFSIRFLV